MSTNKSTNFTDILYKYYTIFNYSYFLGGVIISAITEHNSEHNNLFVYNVNVNKFNDSLLKAQ